MKKEAILVLLFLFNLQIVNAQQEITLFGQSYPIIIIAPIFFMALISLFFFGLILKDNLGKLKIPKINVSKIKIKHPEKKISREIKTDFKNKFNILKEKSHKIGAQQSFNELSEILKEFLREKFSLKHEFAFAELGSLIKGHIKDIELANKISALKYSGADISSLQVRLLFKEFENLLKDYKFKPEELELGFFGRVKSNLLDLFRRKEVKLNIKELREKAPVKPALKPVEAVKVTEKKPGIFSILFNNLNNILKKKELEIKKIEAKPKLLKAKEVVKEQEVVKPAKKYKFVLFTNLINKIRKTSILNLIKNGKNALFKNPALAKRYYARALLSYYKLPIQEEKEIADELMDLHDKILSVRAHEKTFMDVSKNLIEMKHKGEHVSKKSISLLNTLKNFIEREELLAAAKLKEFSYKLKHEEKKLGHFIRKEEHLLGGKIKENMEKFGSTINNLPHKSLEAIKQDEDKFKNMLHKEEHEIGRLFNREKLTKELPKHEIAKKTINLVDHHKSRLEFLYKQPKVEVKHEKASYEEPKKVTNKQLRLLQKQRNDLYNKLIELEEGKITHDKLN